MLEEWQKGIHIVWAIREKKENISLFEKVTSKMYFFFFNLLGDVTLPASGGDFTLLDRAVIDAIVQSAREHVSVVALISSTGFNSVCLPYTKQSRKSGHSKWTFSKKLTAFIDSIVGYSCIPMRAMSVIGLVVALLGFFYASLLIGRVVFFNVDVSIFKGWSSLMVMILLIGGGQIIMLGLLGEYLWRTFRVSRNVPLFFVEQSEGFETDGLKENE